jgi:predicted aspartyl protease
VRFFSSCKFLIAFACAAPAAAQPTTTVVETVRGAGEIDPVTETETVDFRIDEHDRMTVPVRLSGNGPYRFLVDTGADRTAVSTALATHLRLADGPTATLHSVTGTFQVKTAHVPALELTNDRVRSIEAPLLERAHMGADGILGVDSLRSQRVIFDFRTRAISIVPSVRRMKRDEADTIVVTGKLRRGHLIVTSARANSIATTVVLDTGSEVTMGNLALRAKLEARGKLGTPELIEMMSVTGQKLLGEAFYLNRVDIGEVRLANLMILFSNAPIFRSLNLDDRPAVLLGMNAMQGFDMVSIDFVKKQLRMMVPEHGSLRSRRGAAARQMTGTATDAGPRKMQSGRDISGPAAL